jgi:hypothetical protein
MNEQARVARFCLPGRMWYIAVCEACHWADLSWKHRDQATRDRDRHNATYHDAALSDRVGVDAPR